VNRLRWIVLLVVTVPCLAICEQASPATDPRHVKVYSRERGLMAPILRLLNLPISASMKCDQKVDGKVELSMLVDTDGRAQNIMFIGAEGTNIDRLALQLAENDRFVPASFDGKPVVAGVKLRMGIESCLAKSKDAKGNEADTLQLRSMPSQQLILNDDAPDEAALVSSPFNYDDKEEEDLSKAEIETRELKGAPHPVPLVMPSAEFTEEARKKKISGTCLISLIVDPQGMPRNVKITRSLESGLDRNALVAVNRYRFKPAMKNGEPVPAYVEISVEFRLY